MRKVAVIVLVVLGVAFAGLAEAAPKKRTRNQNRIGPYAAAFVGLTSYTGDQRDNEQTLQGILSDNNIPFQNVVASTDDSDFGYQLTFGYRFHRFIAAELGLVQYGKLVSSANGDLDFPDDGQGFLPANVELSFSVGGPLFSVLGLLPLNDKLELYGRVGYLFASSEREFSSRVNGENGVTGSAKGDSQNLVYGAGVTWNINQMYSARGEYQILDGVGDKSRNGTEDLNVWSLGVIVRF
jgi:hypothetical protein